MRHFISSALLGLALQAFATAQHCQPIYESYLSEITLKRSKEGLRLHTALKIIGGRGQLAYQAYVLAFLEKDAARVPAPPPDDVIDLDLAIVLHTQLVTANDDGEFVLNHVVDGDALAKKMIAHRKLTDADRTVSGGWGIYKDRVRLAVFVPFLDDPKYSVIEGLPEDRHYCNPENDRAILFQTLPYRLSINFGIVKARRVAEGTFVVEVNGDRPALKRD